MRRVVFLLVLTLSWPAWAIDIGPCRFVGTCVSVSGQIVQGDAAKFAAVTEGYPAGTFVFLRGPGGNAAEALEMGDIIWRRGFNTAVSPTNGACASACAIVFLAGRHSVIAGRSILLFHLGRNAITGEPMPADIIDQIATELTKYGLAKRQAWALLTAAPPEGGRFATEAWAQQLGIRYQRVPNFLWLWQNCQAKFCLALP